MAVRGERVSIGVAQIGALNQAEVMNALDLANSIQRAFVFHFEDKHLDLGEELKLPNGGYDLDSAIRKALRNGRMRRPIIFVTSQPYSDIDNQHDPEGFFFVGSVMDSGDVFALSTHLWETLPGKRSIQPYILVHLGIVVLWLLTELAVHDEQRSCPLDYCDDPRGVDKIIHKGELCPECRPRFDACIRKGQITLEQAGAVQQLLNRASGRKQAFVAMPFARELQTTYVALRNYIKEHGWKIVRADELSYPRIITDAIMLSILSSDLVIADITGSNPNVFYELGWAHAMDRDVIILTQEEKIPFDVTTHRTIKYKNTRGGLTQLLRDLSQAIG